MTIDHTRTGWTVISAFVTREKGTVGPVGEPREWLETQKYMDYTDDEARALYAEHLRENGLTETEG